MTNKLCNKCGESNRSNFYTYRPCVCKSCVRKDLRNYRVANPKKIQVNNKNYRTNNPEQVKVYRITNNEKARVVNKTYRIKNAIKVKATLKKWQLNNKHKAEAHRQVKKAIKSGDLVRMPCQICGDRKVHAHHEDYSMPLDVLWLCIKHHMERHAELRIKNED